MHKNLDDQTPHGRYAARKVRIVMNTVPPQYVHDEVLIEEPLIVVHVKFARGGGCCMYVLRAIEDIYQYCPCKMGHAAVEAVLAAWAEMQLSQPAAPWEATGSLCADIQKEIAKVRDETRSMGADTSKWATLDEIASRIKQKALDA